MRFQLNLLSNSLVILKKNPNPSTHCNKCTDNQGKYDVALQGNA